MASDDVGAYWGMLLGIDRPERKPVHVDLNALELEEVPDPFERFLSDAAVVGAAPSLGWPSAGRAREIVRPGKVTAAEIAKSAAELDDWSEEITEAPVTKNVSATEALPEGTDPLSKKVSPSTTLIPPPTDGEPLEKRLSSETRKAALAAFIKRRLALGETLEALVEHARAHDEETADAIAEIGATL